MKTVPDTEKWVWLSLAVNTVTQKAKKLIESYGSAEAVYAAPQESYKILCPSISGSDAEKLSDKNLSYARKIITQCAKKKIRIITPQDTEYPQRLWEIPNPPVVLYARGELLFSGGEVAIAVVGTRRATKNGEAAAKKIGREIALCGGTVVTGLAHGIDSLAAKGAVEAGGKTVAVLGCGVDICYPRENKRLFEAVIKSGTVLSEYPPGTNPVRTNFPKRNRIMSGISLGTVVVEAPEKSGALITASYALEQNRDVFAVPSGIFEATAEGSNRLIREGATPVMSGEDVMSEYVGVYGDKIIPCSDSCVKVEKVAAAEKSISISKETLDSLSTDERAIIESFRGEELRADDISSRSGLNMSKVLSLLTLLEIRGHIRQLAGGRFSIKNSK